MRNNTLRNILTVSQLLLQPRLKPGGNGLFSIRNNGENVVKTGEKVVI